MTHNDEWADFLDDDEKILWQGRPVPGFELNGARTAMGLFGLVFAGFAVFWMAAASGMTSDAPAEGLPGPFRFFWLFGIPFFVVGLLIIASATALPPYLQKYTWYTLTDKRGIIATNVPYSRKKLKSYPVTINGPLELEDGDLQTVYFARETKRGSESDHTIDIGFERITEGREVYKLLREIRAKDLERRNT